MKRRGMASPDLGDALAMSFSVTVQRRAEEEPPDPMSTHYEMRRLAGGGMWF